MNCSRVVFILTFPFLGDRCKKKDVGFFIKLDQFSKLLWLEESLLNICRTEIVVLPFPHIAEVCASYRSSSAALCCPKCDPLGHSGDTFPQRWQPAGYKFTSDTMFSLNKNPSVIIFSNRVSHKSRTGSCQTEQCTQHKMWGEGGPITNLSFLYCRTNVHSWHSMVCVNINSQG